MTATISILMFLASFGGLAWLWGYARNIKVKTIAEMKLKEAEDVSHAKAIEANIYSKPVGSKSDIISRL